MITADQYGNAAAYFANSSNYQTAFFVGYDSEDGNLGYTRATYYSVIRNSATSPPAAMTPTQRKNGGGFGGCAIPGRQGPRPVAFPLSDNWNFDQPLTT